MKLKILLTDNDPDFLRIRTAYLSKAGYDVCQANNVEEARQILQTSYIHLVILDIRMVDDDDPTDKSGLVLAEEEEFEYIPKIILTGFPTFEEVRKMLVGAIGRNPYALDFVDKKDGAEAMVESVNSVVAKFIKINSELELQWDNESMLNSQGVIGSFERDLPYDQQVARVEELDDLLCRLFLSYQEVQVLSKTWFRRGIICLTVRASTVTREDFFMMTCGRWQNIQREEKTYNSCAPHQFEFLGARLISHCRTTHYGANLWQLIGVEVRQLESVEMLFGANLPKLKIGIKSFFEDTLDPWRKQRQPEPRLGTMGEFYRKLDREIKHIPTIEQMYEKINALGREGTVLRLIDKLSFSDDKLYISFPNHLTFTFCDPIPYLFSDNLFPPKEVFLRNSPGDFCLDTLLYDRSGKVLLTDFSSAGQYPTWHDFAHFEAMIRFKLLDASNLLVLYNMEKQLLRGGVTTDNLNQSDVEQELKKVTTCIILIRMFERDINGVDDKGYFMCLFYQVAYELLKPDLSCFRKEKDTAQLLYRVMLMAMLVEAIGKPSVLLQPNPTSQTLEYDRENHIVRIGTRVESLTDAEAIIFTYLWEHAGQLCSREDILKDVLGVRNPSPEQKNSYLNANIHRIRAKIEPDIENPRYLLTIYGGRVKLVAEPKE